MKTIDTKGLASQKSLIMMKEALLQTEPGKKIKLITDNDASLEEMVTYLREQEIETGVTSEKGVHTLIVERPDVPVSETDPDPYYTADPVSTDYVVAIGSEFMGEGEPELGKVLMENFVDNLKLQSHLPTHVVLYNSGVKLAMKGKTTCQSLSELEVLGCRIMICDTCIDHYGLQYDIGVGVISNMVTITETLVATGHVVNP
jgi:selenium metabolism protein YedF